MEIKFNSQICTTMEQSERLLALGLMKETADIVYYFSQSLAQDWTIVPLADGESARYIQGLEIPAWSLHRLIEMMPTMIRRWNQEWELSINGMGVIYFRKDTTSIIEALTDNVYENMILSIEWLIKEGYFQKKYLEE